MIFLPRRGNIKNAVLLPIMSAALVLSMALPSRASAAAGAASMTPAMRRTDAVALLRSRLPMSPPPVPPGGTIRARASSAAVGVGDYGDRRAGGASFSFRSPGPSSRGARRCGTGSFSAVSSTAMRASSPPPFSDPRRGRVIGGFGSVSAGIGSIAMMRTKARTRPWMTKNKAFEGGDDIENIFHEIGENMIQGEEVHPQLIPLTTSTNASEKGPTASKQKTKTKMKGGKNKKKKRAALQRVDKVLADRGIGTRSRTFILAKSQRIHVLVRRKDHGEMVEERVLVMGPSEKIRADAALYLDGQEVPGPTPLLLVYHKPKFVLSVMEDEKRYRDGDPDKTRRHLGEALEPRHVRSGMHPVGRLDYDTSGLILFSSDGKLTQRLLHPRRRVQKEYVATVRGALKDGGKALGERLAGGVDTAEGTHVASLLDAGPSEYVPGSSDKGEGTDDGDKDDGYAGPYSDVRLFVTEGKHRMVRRMLANCGYPVAELRRLRHGSIQLDDLPLGEFRTLTDDELHWAEALLR